MLRLKSIAELSGLDQPLYLALGVFDGVHLGHQAVIGAVVERAKAREDLVKRRATDHPELPFRRHRAGEPPVRNPDAHATLDDQRCVLHASSLRLL